MDKPRFTRTSTTAIFSLLCSLSFFIGVPIVGSVVGIVLGRSAKKQIDASNGELTGREFASIGVSVGWFGFLVWGIGLVFALLAALTGVLGTVLATLAGIAGVLLPFILEILFLIGLGL